MIARFYSYFSRLRALLGTKGALVFSFWYAYNKCLPDKEGSLRYIKVGQYAFYFPSLPLFNGIWMQIFFDESYYIAKTEQALEVVDAGANIGVSLLYIKLRVPNARVTCIEPNPASREVLEKNISANGWQDSVRVLPFALGKAKGELELFVEAGVDTSASASTKGHLGARGRKLKSVRVPVEPLSQYVTGPLDFVKIDIEGAEFDVLEELSASGALSHINELQIEYHFEPNFFTRPLSDMLSLLESAGYKTAIAATAPPHKLVRWSYNHEYMVYAWR